MVRAKAVFIDDFGGPEVLAVRDNKVRDPQVGEVRVRVAASGLNRADCLQRRGVYPAPSGVAPDIPGLEFSGEIESIGEGVLGWSIGDRVMGIVSGAGMCSHVVTSSREIVPVPDGMELEQAAGVPEVFMTAYDALFLQGGIQIGDVVLLHAAASGIGTAASQLCRAAGALSLGTSRTASKLERCKVYGLDHQIEVRDGTFYDEVRRISPSGVDIVLDTVGAAYLRENVKCLATRGRVVVIGLVGGAKADLNLGLLLQKRGQIHGSVLRSRSSEDKARLTQSFRKQVLPMFETKGLQPVVDEVLSVSQVQEAHQRMDANETFGKLVLKW